MPDVLCHGDGEALLALGFGGCLDVAGADLQEGDGGHRVVGDRGELIRTGVVDLGLSRRLSDIVQHDPPKQFKKLKCSVSVELRMAAYKHEKVKVEDLKAQVDMQLGVHLLEEWVQEKLHWDSFVGLKELSEV